MKTYIRFPLCFMALLFIILTGHISKAQTDNINKNNFYVGAQGNAFIEYFPQFQALHYNTLVEWGQSTDFQRYEGWMGTNNRIYGGLYDTVVGTSPPYNPYPSNERLPNGFVAGESHFLTEWHNTINSNDAGSIFMGSARVYHSCTGQRSTYQVEDNSVWIAQIPGYGYEQTDMTNADYTDNWKNETQRVKRCQVGVQSTGYIAKKLYENGEQADVILRSESAKLYSDQKRIGDNFHWYMKPRMRIDSNFANNQNNWSKKVVKIEIYNYAGRLLSPTIDILVSDFLDANQHYNGNYIENFINQQTGQYLLEIFSDSLVAGADSSKYYSSPDSSKIDYRVYWYGEVDVMLDYVRLDDEWAHFLFTDPMGTLDFDVNRYQFGRRMNDEVSNINGTGGLALFYMDEFYWNHIPCMAETNRLIKQWAPNSGIIVMTSYSPGIKNRPTTAQLYEKLKQEGLYDDFVLIDKYPIYYNTLVPPNLPLPDSIKQRYIATTYTGAYPLASSNAQYNQNINENIYEQDWYRNDYIEAANVIKTSSTNTAFISTIQVHSWESNFARINCNQSIDGWEFRREPTNEEIALQTYFSMCYGAKHIHYFMQWTFESSRVCNGNTLRYYDQGITGHFLDAQGNRAPRYYNYYGEPKYNFISDLNNRIKGMGSVMYNTNGLKYDASATVNKSELPKNYVTDLKSYYRDISSPFSFSTSNEDIKKYWELGFFNDPNNQYSKYFILLNKRCVPEKTQGDGDIRWVKIKFDPSQLPSFNNWKLTDQVTGQSIVFDKNNQGSGGYLDLGSTQNSLGYFNPAEGKLFKLAPVMQEGGTLVVNEEFGGVAFTCWDTVFNDSKNIIITDTNSSINFTDSASIIMTGGTFQTSSAATMSGPGNKNIFQSTGSNHKWGGLRFNGSTVKIYDAKFLDISSPAVNHAVKMLNCSLGDIRNNIFTMNTDTSVAVHSVYTSNEDISFYLYINYNTITMNSSRTNAIQVQGFSGLTMPLYTENNTMTSNGYATGIMLSTITSGVINNNSITGFATGINTLFSTVDMFGNYVTNNSSLSDGILATDGSFLNMTNNGTLVIGGMNTFTNTYDGASINMHLVNSLFEMEEGSNIFDITSSTNNLDAYHIYGTFPEDANYNSKQFYNCFKLDGLAIEDPDLPTYDITMGPNHVTIAFIPYQCWAPEFNGNTIVDIGNDLFDTIPNFGGGEGGSYPGVKKKYIVSSAKSLFDSISIQIRHRDYDGAKNNCYELIENYPDSIQSLEVLSTLFLSVISSDTTTAAMTELKTFYENLILDHSEITTMVTNCNYLVQKCKVRLRQYQSALIGFQEIISQNPYSYLGLLARWDYMATSLLIAGQGGAFRGEGDDDKSPFTKEQRKIIKETVSNVNEINKNNDEVKIKKLEQKSEAGDVAAVKELKTLKLLKETNKTQRPKDVFEHIKAVNKDIQTVFSKDIKISSKQQNSVPLTFRISQNYPNPFNPTTKINYDLPKDSKVSIVIYDILGREVKRLVNNEIKQAGSYIVDFNAANYASGVYFYRIEAEEPNGNKFVDSKKMVLLK